MEMVKAMAQILETQKQKERRPIMAHLTSHFSRSNATKLLEFPVSQHEWRNSKIHAMYPGALQPIEVIKTTRQHFNMEELIEFLGHLDEEHLQKHAYGAKDYKSKATGALIQLDAVSAMSSTRRIIQQYEARLVQVKGLLNLCAREGTQKRTVPAPSQPVMGVIAIFCARKERKPQTVCAPSQPNMMAIVVLLEKKFFPYLP